MFDEQDHGYFTHSMDHILMESLLFSLGQKEKKTKFHHHYEAWEENSLMGFAPFFKENKSEDSEAKDPYNILH